MKVKVTQLLKRVHEKTIEKSKMPAIGTVCVAKGFFDCGTAH